MVFFKGKAYQIKEAEHKYRLCGQKVLVFENEEGEVALIHKDKQLRWKLYEDLPKENNLKKLKIKSVDTRISNWRLPRSWHPGRYHPWKVWKRTGMAA